MNRLRFTGAGLARSVGLLLLLGQPSSPARGDDQPKESAAPDPTGASYYGPRVSTTGALTNVDGKVTPTTELQDLKLTKVSLNVLWAMVAGPPARPGRGVRRPEAGTGPNDGGRAIR